MNSTIRNICIRCGKQRIVVRTWKEKFDTSVIVNVETACPDVQCQKEVERANNKQRDKNNEMKLRSKQRAINRRSGKHPRYIAA